MRLFGYYAWHSVVNQLRKLFKTWVLIFLVICMAIGGLIGFGAAMLEDAAGEDEEIVDSEVIEEEEPDIPLQQDTEALELVDVRQTLESGLIGQAMTLMTEEHLARIEETVREMESLADQGQALAAVDSEFHRQLFEPLGNELLTHLMSVFWDVYSHIHAEAGMEATSLHATALMHREIYEAVRSGDKALASERINSHFDGIREAIAALVNR